MPFEVTISDLAKDDLVNGHAFYESQEPGAGDYFLACVDRDIDALGDSAGIHAKPDRRHHRMICSKHPYAVFYTCIDRTVKVVAVLDLRSHPRRIQDTLDDR
jgi:hypothetical protein